MTSGTVLVADDEPTVREVVVRYLRREGFHALEAGDGPETLRLAPQADLIILDLMLPGVDGLEVCRRLRATGHLPIIMLTARGEEPDRLLGLGLGADDYVVKPFSPRELVARVQAVLRRTASGPNAPILHVGDLAINPWTRAVERSGLDVSLTGREFDLLLYLAQHPRQVFTREQLLDAVWDFHFGGGDDTVTVHVRRLREKVEADPARPRYIKTVWGVGYKLEP